MITEADTCRKYVLPKLYDAGWSDDQLREQVTFTDGRIVVINGVARRKKQKRADYILRYRRDIPIAIVEAKAAYKNPGDGLQQAMSYAETLGLKFAYATNGHGIVEHDYLTGREGSLDTFPSPDELWTRLRRSEGLDDPKVAERLLTPYHHAPDRIPRYYQEIAIQRAYQAIVQGKRRVLLTMATGSGKTLVAFQICWRLWTSRWNLKGEHRRPRILYLADRNILVDDPKDKTFAPFSDARKRIEGEAVKSREIYFSTYQSIARDERRPGLYREYPPDFFDLIVVDECHRGSAADESNWREILEYFHPAAQLGMTATPLRDDNRDTYEYFGNPVYTYSLRQGIEDGFLAPYRVHRVITEVDATGYRPGPGEIDQKDQPIPDRIYDTPDFDKVLVHAERRRAIAKHLTDYLKKTNRFDKTIIFCVDQEAARLMRKEISDLSEDLVRQHPDYVCRVVSDEGDIGKGHLSRFQELESVTPVILTTSQMLTTGVDAPMVRNVVIARMVNSMTDFKQIIGRGTRVRDDYGKYFFTILDYTGSALRKFADPDFDGEPAQITEEETDDAGNVISCTVGGSPAESGETPEDDLTIETGPIVVTDDSEGVPRRKFYVEGKRMEIAASLVYELDTEGRQLRVVRLTDYTQEKVRELFPSAAALRAKWARSAEREAVLEALAERGIDLDQLRDAAGQPEADAFDLLCHVVYNAPLRTRRERADRLRKEHREYFERFKPEARIILDQVLEKYAEHGVTQLADPAIFQTPPLSEHGNALEIADRFGGAAALRKTLEELQTLLYAA